MTTPKTLTRVFLSELLNRAIHAPSGDNSQPWRFSVKEDSITLLNIPNADGTLYNFEQRGSYLAHGTVIENISLLAQAEGYSIAVKLFPSIKDATAQISFIPNSEVGNPALVDVIEKRTSNRKPYKKIPLQQGHRESLLQSIKNCDGAQLRFAEGSEAVSLLARTVSTNEQLLMENRTLHDFLFGIIRWTRKEEATTPGLYLKTMELPPPVQFLFRFVFRYWSAVRLLNHIGLSHFIPKQSAPVYAASSAFGALIIKGRSPADFVFAGRALQRIWLTATSLGVSIQPVTAIPYLAQRVKENAADAFTVEHQNLIKNANETISLNFELNGDEHIAMLFRLGYGDAPSATSSKAKPVFVEM